MMNIMTLRRSIATVTAGLSFLLLPAMSIAADNTASTPRELGIMVGKAMVTGDTSTLEGLLPSRAAHVKIFSMTATINMPTEQEFTIYHNRVLATLRKQILLAHAELPAVGFNVAEVVSIDASFEMHGDVFADVTVVLAQRNGTTYTFLLDECIKEDGLWYFHDIDPGKIDRQSIPQRTPEAR